MTGYNTTQSRPVIAILLVASTLLIMSGALIVPTLPAIQTSFAGTQNVGLLVRLVLTLPALFLALSAPLMGVLVDRVGRKPLLLVSTAVYGLAGGAGYVLDSLVLLLASRAALGLATAGVVVSATTLIADYFTGERRDTVMGWQAASAAFGGVVFLLVGGPLADIGWRVPFLVYLVPLLLLPLMVRYLPEPEVNRPGELTLTNLEAIRQFLASIPVKTLAFIYAIALVGFGMFYMMAVQMPFYLATTTGATGTLIGIALASVLLMRGVVSMQFQRVKARLGVVPVLALFFGLMGVGYGIISLSGRYLPLVIGLMIAGGGAGFLVPALNVWTAAAVPPAVRGRALGGVTSMLYFGEFLSPLASTPISTRVGLGATFGLVGLVLLGLALLFGGLSLKTRTPPPRAEQEPL